MASASLDQIEREFAELPMQLQLNLLERLVHQLRTKIGCDQDVFAAEIAEMAKDPQIIQELKAIDAEFRHTEGDGLGKP
jgi:hypothetical protein